MSVKKQEKKKQGQNQESKQSKPTPSFYNFTTFANISLTFGIVLGILATVFFILLKANNFIPEFNFTFLLIVLSTFFVLFVLYSYRKLQNSEIVKDSEKFIEETKSQIEAESQKNSNSYTKKTSLFFLKHLPFFIKAYVSSRLLKRTIAVGGGIGGILTIYFAYQANQLFEKQNQKINTQNLLLQSEIEIATINQQFEAQKQLAEVRYNEIFNILSQSNNQVSKELIEHALRNFRTTYLMKVNYAEFNYQHFNEILEKNTIVKKVEDSFIHYVESYPNQEPLNSLLEANKRRFNNLNLEGIDLRGLNLKNATLIGTNLKGAKLQSCNLSQAILTGANLENAKLDGSNLSEAIFHGADLTSSSLIGCNLRKAQLQACYLKYAKLQGSDLYYAQIVGSDLSYAKLQGADMRFASLQGTRLFQTDFKGAYSTNTNLITYKSYDDDPELTLKSLLKFRTNKLHDLSSITIQGFDRNQRKYFTKNEYDSYVEVLDHLDKTKKTLKELTPIAAMLSNNIIDDGIEEIKKHLNLPLKVGIDKKYLKLLIVTLGRLDLEEAQKIYDEYNQSLGRAKEKLFTDEELKKFN